MLCASLGLGECIWRSGDGCEACNGDLTEDRNGLSAAFTGVRSVLGCGDDVDMVNELRTRLVSPTGVRALGVI